MCFTSAVTRTPGLLTLLAILALVAGCKTTPVARSPDSPGTPAPAGAPGSSGTPVQVQGPDRPGKSGRPSAGQGAGAPAPGSASVPSPQPGTPSAAAGGDDAAVQSGDRQPQPGSTPAGAAGREKSDDDILAEALEELGKRPEPGQQGEGAGRQAPVVTEGSAATDSEKKRALGAELEQGFAEFDGLILGEQQANRERADQEEYGGFPAGEDLLAEGDPGQGQAGGELQTAMVDPDPTAIQGEPDIPTRSHSQVPPDLVDAKNDDIIARQLREAAMKEQDPELREKLWDEYRKYKRDSR